MADRSAWRSEAEGGWLVIENEGNNWVDVGSIVVVTEGARPVAYFHVREVAGTA